jgi:hypothetical protein
MQLAMLIVAMMLGLIVLFRLLLAIISPRNNRKRDKRRFFRANQPFHVVSIEPIQSSCKAAKSVKYQRFLSEETPALPLAKCDAAECECRYMHHTDRRGVALDRRLGPVEESDESEFWSLRNRRSFLGRRITEK